MDDNSSKKIIELIELLQSDIKDVKTTLGSHTNILNSHTASLDTHTKILNSHTSTLESHTKILNTHTESLDTHTNILNSHTASLDTHTKILNSHTATLGSHTKILNSHTASLESHTESLVEIETTNKIYGDMYKINNDNIRKIEKRTKNLEKRANITPDPENILLEIA